MPKKRFALLSSYTYPETSGSGINAYNLAKALINSGHKAKVISFKRSTDNPPADNVVRIPYYSRTLIGKLSSLSFILPCYFYFILRSDVLVIYGNKIIAWELALIIAKLFGKKVVFRSLLFNVDDILTTIKGPGIRKKIYRKLLNAAHCYYSINGKFSETWLIESQNPKVLFECPQGVDTMLYSPVSGKKTQLRLKQKLNLPTDKHIIISAGFLIQRKQPLELFNAIAQLPFNFHYIYLGEFKFGERHFLRNLNMEATSLYTKGKEILDDNIQFPGFVGNINLYFKCADVFIHGQSKEVPNVVYESMASGVPVIVSQETILLSTFLKPGENCLAYTSNGEIPRLIQVLREDHELRKRISKNAIEWINTNAAFPVVTDRLTKFLFE